MIAFWYRMIEMYRKSFGGIALLGGNERKIIAQKLDRTFLER